MKTVFFRALDAEDKASAILAAIRDQTRTANSRRFDVDPGAFSSVPRSPFAYWVNDRFRDLFGELRQFEADGRTVKQGLATADDFRFVRAWWSVPQSEPERRWVPFAKGGVYSPYYADTDVIVNWERSGSEIKANLNERGQIRSNVWMLGRTASEYFLRPGLTWPLRGARFSAQAVPEGSIFSVAGKMAFVTRADLGIFHALMNSSVFAFLIRVQSDAVRTQFEVGLVKAMPIPSIPHAARSPLATLAARAWSLKRSLDRRRETSHSYALPALLQATGETFCSRADDWTDRVRSAETALVAIQAEIDERCFELYGIDEADRRAINEGFGASVDAAEGDDTDVDDESDDTEDVEGAEGDAVGLTAELASWAVGVAFGRFDVRLATGERALPNEPEPFDPLPVCSPGMLTGDDGFALTSVPEGYPLAVPENGILVDDPGHERDLTAAARSVFDVVFGIDADARWREAAELLDPKELELRTWLAKRFFEYHLKRYSKSRRKAPILWQLATPSASYSVWIYVHRLTADSLFHIQNEVVAPKLALEERRQTALAQAAGPNPTASQRREIAETDTFVGDLRTLLSEVRRIAPLWRPDLNDGVVLTMAPLWRLVPQHRTWQRALKSAWDALCSGKYDWAQLAMHFWPERIVPKCVADRSLAIAHGLEEVFWVEDAKGKWEPRNAPTRSVEELVRERTSPAVKTALQSLLDAPAPASARRRGQARAGASK